MEATAEVRAVEKLARRAPAGALVEAAKRTTPARAVQDLRRAQVPLIEAMAADFESRFQDLGERVAKVAEPMLAQSTLVEAVLVNDPNTQEVRSLIEHILTSSSLREWAGKQMSPGFRKWYELNQLSTARILIQLGLATNLTQQTIARILEEGGRRAGLVDIVGDTRAALFRAIEQGIEGGLNPRETARLVQQMVPEGRFVNAGSRYRAQLIARTETLHAQRRASIERYRTNKIQMVVAFDGDSDEECAARDGQQFTLDDAEVEMNATHPNCVLAFGPVVT